MDEFKKVQDEAALNVRMQTPSALAMAILWLCAADDTSVPVAELCRPEYDSHGKPAGELLAVMINGDKASRAAASFELSERLKEALMQQTEVSK